MPICSYGGAKCCAGSSEKVKKHEKEKHNNKNAFSNNKNESFSKFSLK